MWTNVTLRTLHCRIPPSPFLVPIAKKRCNRYMNVQHSWKKTPTILVVLVTGVAWCVCRKSKGGNECTLPTTNDLMYTCKSRVPSMDLQSVNWINHNTLKLADECMNKNNGFKCTFFAKNVTILYDNTHVGAQPCHQILWLMHFDQMVPPALILDLFSLVPAIIWEIQFRILCHDSSPKPPYPLRL